MFFPLFLFVLFSCFRNIRLYLKSYETDCDCDGFFFPEGCGVLQGTMDYILMVTGSHSLGLRISEGFLAYLHSLKLKVGN